MSYPIFLGLVRISSANRRIVFDEGGADLNADIATGDYYVRGDGTASDLLKAIADALNAAGALTYTAVIGDVRADAADASMQIVVGHDDVANIGLFKAGSTFDEGLIGFSGAQSGSAAYPSTLSPSAVWVAPCPHRELEPIRTMAGAVTTTLTGRVKGLARSAAMRMWSLDMFAVREERVLTDRNTTDPTATLEAFFDSYGHGAALEVHDVDINTGTTLDLPTSSTLVDVCHFTQDTLERFAPERLAAGTPLYSFALMLHKRVTS